MKNFFLIPDRFAHYREDVFIYIAKELKIKGYNNFLLIDINDQDITKIPIGNIKEISKNYSILKLKNFYFKKYKNIILYQINLLSYFLEKKPQLIIAWGESHRISTLFLLLISKLIGSKLVLWSHGFYGNESFLKLQWRKFFYSLSPLILLYGSEGKRLMNMYLPKKRSYIIGNSTNLKKFDISFNNYDDLIHSRKMLIRKYKIKSIGEPILLSFIGRLTNLKKLDILIDIINYDSSKNIELWLIGEGDESAKLKRRCKNLGIENRVHFFGEIYSQKEIHSILEVTDIFACPSQLGLSVATALSSGLNILTSSYSINHMPETDVLIENNLINLTDFTDLKFTYKILKEIYKKSKNIEKRKQNQLDCYKYFSAEKHSKNILKALQTLF